MKLSQVILIICFGFFEIIGKGNAQGNYLNEIFFKQIDLTPKLILQLKKFHLTFIEIQ
jgi:hypothetical protein